MSLHSTRALRKAWAHAWAEVDLTAGRDKFLIYLINLWGSPCLHFNSLFYPNFLGMILNILTSSPTSCKKHIFDISLGFCFPALPRRFLPAFQKVKVCEWKGRKQLLKTPRPLWELHQAWKLRLTINTECCSCDLAAVDEPYPVFHNAGPKLLQLTFCSGILNSHSITIISVEPACRGSRKGLSGQCWVIRLQGVDLRSTHGQRSIHLITA